MRARRYGDRGGWGTPLTGTRTMSASFAANTEAFSNRFLAVFGPISPWPKWTLPGECVERSCGRGLVSLCVRQLVERRLRSLAVGVK